MNPSCKLFHSARVYLKILLHLKSSWYTVSGRFSYKPCMVFQLMLPKNGCSNCVLWVSQKVWKTFRTHDFSQNTEFTQCQHPNEKKYVSNKVKTQVSKMYHKIPFMNYQNNRMETLATKSSLKLSKKIVWANLLTNSHQDFKHLLPTNTTRSMLTVIN